MGGKVKKVLSRKSINSQSVSTRILWQFYLGVVRLCIEFSYEFLHTTNNQKALFLTPAVSMEFLKFSLSKKIVFLSRIDFSHLQHPALLIYSLVKIASLSARVWKTLKLNQSFNEREMKKRRLWVNREWE